MDFTKFVVIATDLFSHRFREGISFPNFVERSIPEKGKKVPSTGEEEGGQQRWVKRKKGRVKTGQAKLVISDFFWIIVSFRPARSQPFGFQLFVPPF